ncbi:MAG: hypothetical protein FJ333_09330 [Sphingomonadales bacterium]|nr:hypothetical protein [Sphingomonadales bacterium]
MENLTLLSFSFYRHWYGTSTVMIFLKAINLVSGAVTRKGTGAYFWHNLLDRRLYKFEHAAAHSQLVQPPAGVDTSIPKPTDVPEGQAVDWYPAVKAYVQEQGYVLLQQSWPAGSGTTAAESIRPGCKFELREAGQPARFWGVTVVENVGGASGLLGLGYDSPELRPRTAADLHLFYADPRLCPVGTVAASGGKYEFQVILNQVFVQTVDKFKGPFQMSVAGIKINLPPQLYLYRYIPIPVLGTYPVPSIPHSRVVTLLIFCPNLSFPPCNPRFLPLTG